MKPLVQISLNHFRITKKDNIIDNSLEHFTSNL